MRKRILLFGLLIAFAGLGVLSLPRCAHIVAPTGGPRDSVPPRVVRTSPPYGATNVSPQAIRIYFDEYTRVENASANVFFSPPLKYPIQTRLRGRSVEVKIRDTLMPNTTYTVQFGNSIVDLTEKIPLEGYSYVFSTGATVDSALLRGRVVNALSLEPVSDMRVMLYRENIDSLPKTTPPDFTTKTDKEGYFRLTHLPLRRFKIFALKAKSNTMVYNDSMSEVAFRVDEVESYVPRQGDTAFKAPLVALSAFVHEKKLQFLTSKKRPQPGRIAFGFSTSPQGEVKPEILGHASAQLVREVSENQDTVSFWIMDTTLVHTDSLRVRLEYQKADSAGALVHAEDTVWMTYKFPKPAEKKEKEEAKSSTGGLSMFGNMNPLDAESAEEEEKGDPLKVRIWSSRAKSLRPFDSVSITVESVPVQAEHARISVLSLPDSIEVEHTLRGEANRPRTLWVHAAWEEGKNYSVRLLPETFVGIFGKANAQQFYNASGIDPSSFSTLHIALQNAPARALVQVLAAGKTDVVQAQAVWEGAGKELDIRYITPGKVWVRVVDDRNGNGRWDTGDYDTQTEPEPVRYYLEPKGRTRDVAVRNNWEYNLSMDYNTMEK